MLSRDWGVDQFFNARMFMGECVLVVVCGWTIFWWLNFLRGGMRNQSSELVMRVRKHFCAEKAMLYLYLVYCN